MNEAVNLIFSLEFQALQDPEIEFQKKLMCEYGKLRYIGFYVKCRKNMTALLGRSNSPGLKFGDLELEIDKWSTLLTRVFDKTDTATKIMEKVKENITRFVEDESKARRKPLDSKFKITGLRFLSFSLENYYLTMEYLNKNTVYNFATTTTKNKRGDSKSKQFAPVLNDPEDNLVDEQEKEEIRQLYQQRTKLKEELSMVIQKKNMAKDNYSIIINYLNRLEEKNKQYIDYAQRCQKLMQPLTNRLQSDDKHSHLLTPLLLSAIDLVRSKKTFEGNLLQKVRKELGVFNLKKNAEALTKNFKHAQENLSILYRAKEVEIREKFYDEEQYLLASIGLGDPSKGGETEN